jgi:NAD(P)H dehydrogenase (quinone)
MIAVTGATGQLGRLVLAALAQKVPAGDIVALVRSPEKAADLAAAGYVVRAGDYTDPAALQAALTGVEKLLLISSSEVGQRAAQHANVIAAAKAAGVKLLAYTSILHADTSVLALAEEHVATEAALAASGVPYVLLRNGWYLENYLGNVAPGVAHGVVIGAAGDGVIHAAARADYAEAAAVVLTTPDQAGKVYELAGDAGFTMAQFAATLADLSGKPVAYQNLSEADYAKALEGFGLPAPFAAILADSDTGASKGGLGDSSGTLSALIGRPTTPLATVLKAALA